MPAATDQLVEVLLAAVQAKFKRVSYVWEYVTLISCITNSSIGLGAPIEVTSRSDCLLGAVLLLIWWVR